MKSATSYDEWFAAAQTLDSLDGAAEWIDEDASPLYDTEQLEEMLIELAALRQNQDAKGLLKVLDEGLYSHYNDVVNPALYRETYSGESKRLPRTFLQELAKTLLFIKDLKPPALSHSEKLALFEKAAKAYGRSALMLSGGATMGLYHLGVIKALHDTDLLPTVVSGASMGAIVAAWLCSRTKEERKAFFANPEHLHRVGLRFKSFLKILKERSLFDTKQLIYQIKTNIQSDLTFSEAYDRSGLVLNISVSPTRARQKPKILNYLTAPNLLISHATAASCSLPLLFKPWILMERDEQGRVSPYLPLERWADGTLRGDLPMARVSRLHNVNHYIVSQTNPHIYPLLSKSEQPNLTWLAFDVLGSLARAQVKTLLGSAKKYLGGHNTPQLLDQLYSLMAQPYVGDINIHPHIDPFMFRKMVSNPTPEDVYAFLREGERVTWPKIPMIRDQTLISRTFETILQELRPPHPSSTPHVTHTPTTRL